MNTGDNFDFVAIDLGKYRRFGKFTSAAEIERFVGKAKYEKIEESLESDRDSSLN